MANMKADTSTEALAQVLADHAATKWGASRAADLQEPLARTVRTLLELRQNLPDPDTEPGCYPAARPQ